MQPTYSISDGLYVSPNRPNRERIHLLIQYYPYIVGSFVTAIVLVSMWTTSPSVALISVLVYWGYLLARTRFRHNGSWSKYYGSRTVQVLRAMLLIIGISALLYYLRTYSSFSSAINNSNTLWLLYLLPLLIIAQRGTTPILIVMLFLTAGTLAIVESSSILTINYIAQVLWLALISMMFYVFLRYLGDAIADLNLILNIQRRLRESEADLLVRLSGFNEQAFLQETASLVANEFAYGHVNFFRLRPNDGQLECVASVSKEKGGLSGKSLVLDLGNRSSIVGHVLSSKVSHISNDVKSDKLYYFHEAFPNTRSELATPIFVRDRLYGVLDVQTAQRDYFLDQDLKAVEIVANHVGWVIDSSNNIGYLTWTERILAKIGVSFFSMTDLEDVLQEISNLAKQELETDLVVIYCYLPEVEEPVGPIYAGEVIWPDELGRSHYPADSIVHRIRHIDEEVLICENLELIDLNDHPLFQPSIYHRRTKKSPFVTREEVRANAIIRLLSNGECLGVLFLNYRTAQSFSQWDKRRFSFFAHLAALAIQRTQANAQLARLEVAELAQSVHDMLIGDSLGLFKLVSSMPKSLEEVERAGYELFIEQAETMTLRLYNDARYISGVLKDESLEDLISEVERLRIIFIRLYGASIMGEWHGNLDFIPSAIVVNMCAMLREACWNAVRHGKAANIFINVDASPNLAAMEIRDDGRGFEPRLAKPNGGLRNIQRRAEKYSGTLEIESAPGSGSRLKVTIPL